MVTKVIWNKSAIRDFDLITEYLHDTYSLQVAQKFADKIYHKIDYIVKYPTIGRPVTKTKTLKIIRCGDYHHIYYRTKGKTLYLCSFFDTRQDPSKRPHQK